MSSGSHLRNSTLHWRLTQVLKEAIGRVTGGSSRPDAADSPAQKLSRDVQKLASIMSATASKPRGLQNAGSALAGNEQTVSNASDKSAAAEAVDTPQPSSEAAGAKSWQSYMKLIRTAEEPAPPVTPQWKLVEANARGSVDARTRHLVSMVRSARSEMSRSRRVEDLSRHLQQHPQTINLACRDGAVSSLLLVWEETADAVVRRQLREALALLGHIEPPTRRGIRILSIDGGGIRGVLTIELLRELERLSGERVHEMFDLICGVSTGAMLAALLGLLRKSLDEVEEMYVRLGTEVFQQTRFKGTRKLLWEHSYYDTEAWNTILRRNLGEQSLISFARDETVPKMAAVSTLVSGDNLQAFVFRSYNHPHHVQSHYQGGSQYRVWEAIQASAAAPGYFQECRVGDMLHQDGGILVNNPTAIAIHEARQLWPAEPLQCVLSLGTGRFAPASLTSTSGPPAVVDYTSWVTKIRKFVDSATDTEGVHTILNELLPSHTYFRLNPYLSHSVSLDDSCPQKLAQLKEDALMYVRRNAFKLGRVVTELNRPRRHHQRLADWLQRKKATYTPRRRAL